MTDPRRPIATGLDLDAISKFKPIKVDTSFFESFAMIDRALMDTRAVMKPLLESLGKAFSDARNADAALQAGERCIGDRYKASSLESRQIKPPLHITHPLLTAEPAKWRALNRISMTW
jgi:hypothetical protein